MSITFHFSTHILPPPLYIPSDDPMFDITIVEEGITKNNNTGAWHYLGVAPFRSALTLDRGRTLWIYDYGIVEHKLLGITTTQYGYIGRFCSYPLWESGIQLNGVNLDFHITPYTRDSTSQTRTVTVVYPLLYAWSPIGDPYHPEGGNSTLLYNWYEHYPSFIFSPQVQGQRYSFKSRITLDHDYIIQRYDRLVLEWWYYTNTQIDILTRYVGVLPFGTGIYEGFHPNSAYSGYITFDADIVDLAKSKEQALFPYDVEKGIQHARSY